MPTIQTTKSEEAEVEVEVEEEEEAVVVVEEAVMDISPMKICNSTIASKAEMKEEEEEEEVSMEGGKVWLDQIHFGAEVKVKVVVVVAEQEEAHREEAA